MVFAVASIDVRYVCMKTMGLIMAVGGWVHRLAALVGRLATSAKPYKRKIKKMTLRKEGAQESEPNNSRLWLCSGPENNGR